MLIDFHAHSSGISHCCLIPCEEVIDVARGIGIDGMILTNHYQRWYAPDGDYTGLAKRYIEEYRRAKEYGDSVNFRIFFGVEVTMEKHGGAHLLVYGVAEDFLLTHTTLFEYTQEELYRLVKAAGGALVQAHPLRRVNNLLDVRYLDGIEISCHPLYEGTHIGELTKVASEAGLMLTCGGDYHADTHRAHCGVYLPDEIKDGKEIADFILSTNEVTLCVQEVDERASYDFTFTRNKGQRTSKQ